VIKQKRRSKLDRLFYCGDTRVRTKDTWIFSPLLYQLSYITNLNCGGKDINFFLYPTVFVYFFSSIIFVHMDNDKKVIAIDAGNTSVKAGYFNNDCLIEVRRFSLKEIDKLSIWVNSIGNPETVMSSVLSKIETKVILDLFKNCFLISNETKFPFDINYSSAKTLGIDRICNAAYLFVHSKTPFAACIDIGTCLKFDLIHKTKGYLGGSISPGIDLRYKSLNDYTGNLPLLSNKTIPKLVGTSTELSITSGVLNGMKHEIISMIEQYRMEFLDLTFFMTGGDTSFFDFESKNDIFADENLTVKGLYEIFKHNA
jgi:type III pantothenate kinase